MSTDDTAGATKKDVAMIMEMMGQLMQKIQNVEERVGGIEDTVEGMEERITKSVTENVATNMTERVAESVYNRVMPEVHLLIETLRHDVLDAKKDQVARHEDWLKNHEVRIATVERATVA